MKKISQHFLFVSKAIKHPTAQNLEELQSTN